MRHDEDNMRKITKSIGADSAFVQAFQIVKENRDKKIRAVNPRIFYCVKIFSGIAFKSSDRGTINLIAENCRK